MATLFERLRLRTAGFGIGTVKQRSSLALSTDSGKASRLGAENEAIVGTVLEIKVGTPRFGREIQESRTRKALVQSLEIDVTVELNVLPIVQSGPFQCTVVHFEPGHPDNMQRCVGRGALACDVARVGRYFRLVECHI
jgi:hypothetical protein